MNEEELKISETKGLWNKKTKGVFGYVSSYLEDYGCDRKDSPRNETTFTAEKLKKDSTFMEMFGTVTTFWTKEQVVEVIRNHEELLSKSRYNFFPYQNPDGERFVLGVRRGDSGWGLGVSRLGYDDVWGAGDERVVFLPQQSTLKLGKTESELTLELSESLTLAIKICKDNGYKVTMEM